MAVLLRLLTIIKMSFRRLYVTKGDYRAANIDIRRTNLNMLTIGSLLISIIFFILFILSFFPINWPIKDEKVLFFSTFCYSLLSFVAAITFLPKAKRYTAPFLYTHLAMLFTFSIIESHFIHRNESSPIFYVLLTTCPILVIDKTLRMFTFSAVWTGLNIVITLNTKPEAIANTDCLHSALFFLLGTILHMYVSSLRIREFTLKQTIKTERDTDGLTGLLNKSSLSREIRKKLITDKDNGILLIFDADNFKSINDNYGHEEGDDVLKKISEILKNTFRKSDIIGRFGGDEFIIFMTGTKNINIAEEKAKQALYMMNKTTLNANPDLTIKGSIGIASVTEKADTYEKLFKIADNALYASKRGGKNRITIDGAF